MSKKLYFITNRIGKVRHETVNGVEWLVAPLVSMRDRVVMNGLLYLEEEIEPSTPHWDGVPTPLDHPIDDKGNYISANSAEVLATCPGEIRHSVYDNKRLKHELWINLRKSELIGNEAQTAVEKIESGELVNVSTGLYCNIEMAEGESEGRKYYGIARDITPDHIAILLNSEGACDLEDGCGVPRANQKEDKMKRTIVNIELSLGEREMLVWDAYYSNMDLPGYVWRITNTEVIASQAGKLWIIPYELGEDNTIVFGDPAEADIVPVTNNLLKTVQALPGKVINAIKKELGMNKKEKLIGQLLKTNAGFTKEQLEGMEESLLESMAKLATAEGTSEEQLEETPAPEQPVPLAEKPPEWFTQWSTSFEQRFGAVEEAVQGNAKEARQKLIDHIVANSEMTAEDLKDVPDSTLAKMAKPLAPVDFGLRRWPQAGAFNANDYAEAPMPAPATNGAQGGK